MCYVRQSGFASSLRQVLEWYWRVCIRVRKERGSSSESSKSTFAGRSLPSVLPVHVLGYTQAARSNCSATVTHLRNRTSSTEPFCPTQECWPRSDQRL